jgi:hypothetical protein
MMSWVASLAAVRAELAVVQAATSTQRDDAIAAAMAELDSAGLPATQTPHDAIVRTLPRRSRLVAVMGSAAAAVVLVVVGITVARSGDSDPDLATNAAVATNPAAPPAEAAADMSSGGAATEESASPATLGPITGPATVLPEVDTSAQLQAYAAAAPKVTTFATEATTSTDTGDVAADTVADAVAPSSRIVVPPPTCLPVDAVVLGTVAVAGTTATVIQTADGELQALDNACSVLLTASP